MTNAKQRLDKLREHKERTKHRLGFHDQRDHTRHDYLANGLIGDSGGRSSRDREIENGYVNGGSGGSISSDIAMGTNNLFNRRTIATDTSGSTPRRMGRYIGARPERQASIGLTQMAVERAVVIRNQAIAMAKEYWKRHRSQKPTAAAQGVIAPLAMQMKPVGSFFDIGGDNVSLFEDPSMIMGADPTNPSQQTNMLSHVQKEYDQALDQHYQAMIDGGMPEAAAQEYSNELADRFNNYYELYMRRGAASYAMDLQGFVGGEIYPRDSPEYIAAQAMLVEASNGNKTNYSVTDSILAQMKREYPKAYEKLAETLAGPNATDERVGQVIKSQMSLPTLQWEKANPAPAPKGTVVAGTLGYQRNIAPTAGATNPQNKLQRTNPALAADILQRKVEDQATTLPLDAVWSMLDPSIRNQLARMMRMPIVYPLVANAAQVFEKNPTESLNGQNTAGFAAFKSILSQLHTDGGLTDVIVKEAKLKKSVQGTFGTSSLQRRDGSYAGKPTITLSDEPSALQGDAGIAEKMVTMAHEFGHLIDFSALPFGEMTDSDQWHGLADLVGQHGGLPDGVWQHKSPMVAPMLRIINRYMQGPYATSATAIDNLAPNMDGLRQRIVSGDLLEYQQQPREIFARLYEQWFLNETMRKLDAGVGIPGVKNKDEFRQGLEHRLTSGQKSGPSQRFFETADYEASVSDLLEIFNIMGWKMK